MEMMEFFALDHLLLKEILFKLTSFSFIHSFIQLSAQRRRRREEKEEKGGEKKKVANKNNNHPNQIITIKSLWHSANQEELKKTWQRMFWLKFPSNSFLT